MRKRLLTALAVLLLIPFSSHADTFKLDGFSFAQLLDLRKQVNAELWARDEWQAVTVPQGVWIVGEDIPAGTWTVTCADEHRDSFIMQKTNIAWGTSYDKQSRSILYQDRIGRVDVFNPNSEDYKGGTTELTLDISDGMVVIISDVYNKAVFSTYIGKPDLGFR